MLGQNYPNPFNPETKIPFSVNECAGSSQRVVSLKIYNVLAQLVAVPTLEGDPAPNQPISSIKLPCGQYTAFWDGKVRNTGREAASGVYLYELVVDGERSARKAFVAK